MALQKSIKIFLSFCLVLTVTSNCFFIYSDKSEKDDLKLELLQVVGGINYLDFIHNLMIIMIFKNFALRLINYMASVGTCISPYTSTVT